MKRFLCIILSLSLTERTDIFSYTIFPVLGSVALGRAASICIAELPMNDARIKLLNEIEKGNTIIFERIS